MKKYKFYVRLPHIKDMFRRVQVAEFDSERLAIFHILAMYPTEGVQEIIVKNQFPEPEVWVTFCDRRRE